MQTAMIFAPAESESTSMNSVQEADVAPPRVTERSNWSVKNVKTLAIGHDGGALTCSIYLDGKRVGKAEDDGHGGGFWYHFDDRVHKDQFYAEARKFKGDHGTDCYLAEFIDHYEAMKVQRKFQKNGYPVTVEIKKDILEWSLTIDASDPVYGETYLIGIKSLEEVDALVTREKADAWKSYTSEGVNFAWPVEEN